MKTFKTEQEAIDYSKKNPTETVECKMCWDDGRLYEHSFYVNGLYNGELKSYHSNGRLYEHSFYVNGLYNGQFKWHDAQGKLRSHCFYVNGVRNADLDHLAKDNRTPEETELVKATVGDNYFK